MVSLLDSSSVLYVVGSVLLVILVLWLSVTVYFYLLHRRYAHIPGPKIPSLYMGHIPTFMAARKNGKLFEQVVLEWGQQYGPIIVYFIFHHAIVIPFNSKDIKEVLMNVNLPKSHYLYSRLQNSFSERFLGGGLLASYDYDSWKPRRSLHDPSFTRGYLKSLVPSFNASVDSFLEDLRTVADGNTKVLMRKQFKAIILQILGQVAFGLDFSNSLSDEALGLKHVKGDGTLGFLMEHAFRGVEISFNEPFFNIFHPYKTEGYRETVRAIRKIGRECIEKRFKAIANEEEVLNDILTQIVRVAQSDKGIQLDDLIDEFVSFYVAGQETTATLLTFTVIKLCQHPDVQQRVLEEISEVLGDRDYVTQEDIDQLKYMEQVFQEVLRLYPPVAGTGRDIVTDDFKLCGCPIPKGAMIAINYYSNHHNPDIWEDPETFDPSRFSPERVKPDPFIYSPFSTGHRSCIGKVFAMMEAKVILARLLNSFKIDLEEGYQLKVEEATTLRPADDVPCTVVPLIQK